MVYLVLAVEKPTEDESKQGVPERLVGKLEAIVAPNENNAAIKYTRGLKDNLNLDKVEVVVRPFV